MAKYAQARTLAGSKSPVAARIAVKFDLVKSVFLYKTLEKRKVVTNFVTFATTCKDTAKEMTIQKISGDLNPQRSTATATHRKGIYERIEKVQRAFCGKINY